MGKPDRADGTQAERFLSHACDVMNQVTEARMSGHHQAELYCSLHIGTIESLALSHETADSVILL